MTTFKDMNALATAKDFSADLVRELIGDYCVRGKKIDPVKEDAVKLFNRVDWIVNRIGRALNVTGKLDAAKTTFRLDRDADNILSVRFVDLKGKTLYTLFLGEKGKTDKAQFEYILRDDAGKVVVRDHKWTAISKFFAPEKEVAVKKAAAPKKPKATKKEKVVKAVKNPVPAQPAEGDVMAEVNEALADEDVPPAELG